MNDTPTLARQALAEFIGTALLLAAIVGSGIAAQHLSPNDVGLELLENAAATAAVLVAIILALAPVSGAHLNPAVTLVDRMVNGAAWNKCLVYWAAQIGGGITGAIAANLMFSLPAVTLSHRARWGAGLWFGEVVEHSDSCSSSSESSAPSGGRWSRTRWEHMLPEPTGSPPPRVSPTQP